MEQRNKADAPFSRNGVGRVLRSFPGRVFVGSE